MLLKFRIYLFLGLLAMALPWGGMAQNTASQDSISISRKDIAQQPDSLASDTSKVKKKEKNADFKSKISYTAKDSLTYSNDFHKAYLYNEAKVTYEGIELTAAYMEYNFVNNEVYASSIKDSLGVDVGIPVFKKGSETFKCKRLNYNFKTGKAVVYDIVTEQDGSFLHAQKIKRLADGSANLKHGIYTTCDAPHPHFGIIITKGKMMPDDKIVSSFAYMEFEDVPLPLFLPFGFFPNSKKNSISGIIMPAYGEENTRGFYLRDGGYYFALSQYYDLLLSGDVYSKGDWGARARSSYSKRYKFTGSFDVSRYVNKHGILGVDSGPNQFGKTYDFKISWTHSQAATANPSQRFSASVNYSSMSYDKNFNYFGSQGYDNLMTSTKSSSISYSKTWDNANLAVNLGHNQNSQSKAVSFTLPSATFSINRFYPFRRKNPTGDLRWYENLTLSYSSELRNTLNGTEATIFTQKTLKTAQNGYRHSIPFSTNIKFLKYFNFSPSLNYTGMIYTTQIRKSQRDSLNSSTGKQMYYEYIDTLHKVSYAQGFSPSFSVSVNPTLYGTFQFGPKSKINAIRHVITPVVNFRFVPDIKSLAANYDSSYYDNVQKQNVKYGIYSQNIFGTPQSSSRSGMFSFSLGNNLEMKVKSDKDTLTGLKKIVLIQSLSFGTSYDIYRPTNKLSNITISGNSPIINGLNVNYGGTVSPYIMKNAGGDSTIYYWKKNKGLGRLTNAGLSFGYTFQSGGGQNKTQGVKDNKGGPINPLDTKPKEDPGKPKDDFAYFKLPWSFTFSYNLSYSKPAYKQEIVQTLSFNGNISLAKWTINFNSGYDFKNKDFSYTSFSIRRPLHCFEMSINFAPFGQYRYYEFRISAVSQFLRDLKYNQRKDYRDYPMGF